jgi:hypothetical protein
MGAVAGSTSPLGSIYIVVCALTFMGIAVNTMATKATTIR